MKKAVSIWAITGGITGECSVVEACNIAKRAGFDAVEASFDEKGEISFGSSVSDIKEMARRIKAEGGKICSLSTIILSKMDLISDNPDESKYVRAGVEKMMEIASYLEVPSISLHCSSSKTSQKIGYHAAYEKEFECICSLVEKAKQLGVIYCVENYVQGLLVSPMEFCQFIDGIHSDAVGVCFDTANSVFSGLPQHWIETVGTRIHKVHFADIKIRAMRGMLIEFVDPGQGMIDWSTTVSSLENIGFDGYVTVEAFANPRQDDEQRLCKLAQNMDEILNLSRKG